jgi:hypothetical protein
MEAAESSLDSPNIPDMKGGKPTAINAMASSPISAYSPSPSLSSGPAFSDEELAHLSVRQLNQRLQVSCQQIPLVSVPFCRGKIEPQSPRSNRNGER